LDINGDTLAARRVGGAGPGRQRPTCQSCGSARLVVLGPNPDFQDHDIRYCKDCELISTYPPVAAGTLAAFYADEYTRMHVRPTVDFTYLDRRATAQVEMIRRSGLFGAADGGPGLAGRDILDIGCGPGSLLREFERLGARVHGYDAAPAAIEICRSRLSPEARVAAGLFDVESEGHGTFDLIAMSHVLEHIVEPWSFLRRLMRLVRPGGGLFIEVPNHGLRRARQIARRCSHQGSGHVNYFSKAGLRRLIEAAGGVVVAIETAGPDCRSIEIPYGRPRSQVRGFLLKYEQKIKYRLARLGLGRDYLAISDDFPVMRPPAHAEGEFLRAVCSPGAGPLAGGIPR
jgi:2-polyprenyl-3-methyl-5-hydroxy-6-metoxy-1,4-benzoquinol methylase